MKKMVMNLLTTAALALCGATAFAAGNIADIAPCDENGTIKYPSYTAENGMQPGEKLYFIMRFQSPDGGSQKWRFNYMNGSATMGAIFPPQIGLFVSGKQEGHWATYIGKAPSTSDTLTDIIFEYEVKAGDFALPITLALNSSGTAVPASNVRTQNTSSYFLNLARYSNPGTLDEGWRLQYPEVSGSTTNWVDATWTCTTKALSDGANYWNLSAWDTYDKVSKGFYVKSIDFSDNWQTEDTCWRTVHENSWNCDRTPQLVASVTPSNSVSLYVWSTNTDVVTVGGSDTFSTNVHVDPTDHNRTMEVQVSRVTFQMYELTSDFKLKGLSQTVNGGEAELFLSAYSDFNFNDSTSEIIEDFIKVPVRVIEPLPPSVLIEAEKDTATATSDYGEYANRLYIKLSEELSDDLTVRIVPHLSDGSMTDANVCTNYVRFHATNQSVGKALPDAGFPVVTFAAGETEKSLYVFCLRGDAHTLGINTLEFKTERVSGSDAVETENYNKCAINIEAQDPVILEPTEGEEKSAIANTALPITIRVSDTYADLADTNTGYQIYYKLNSSQNKFTELEGSFIPVNGVLYKRNADGTSSGDLPELEWSTSGENEAQIYVKSPISTNDSRIDTAARKFTVYVEPPRSSTVETLDGTTVFNEGVEGGVTFKIWLDDKGNDTGSDLWAFLRPSDNVTNDLSIFSASLTPFIIGMTNSVTTVAKGLRIHEGQGTPTTPVTGTIMLLDGYNPKTGGLPVQFEVVLCTQATYDESKIKQGFDSNLLTLTINNVEPTIDSITLGDDMETTESSGYKFDNVLPKGITNKFTVTVTDPGEYDLVAGCDANGKVLPTADDTNKSFQVKWSFKKDGKTLNSMPSITTYGDPSKNPLEVAFKQKGEWQIIAQIKDKDMTTWNTKNWTDSYIFSFTVVDQPQLTVDTDAEYYEDETQVSPKPKIKVGIGGIYDSDGATIKVKLTVESKAKAGRDAGELVLSTNYLYFTEADTQEVTIDQLDGTSDSTFVITAEVVNDPDDGVVHYPTGKHVSEYYLKGWSDLITVVNVDPVATFSPESNEHTNAWTTAHTLRWRVNKDVYNDLENTNNGITVTIDAFGVTSTTNVTERNASGVFIPDLSVLAASEEGIVTITVSDKDYGEVSRTWKFEGADVKYLYVKATGPGGTSTSASSQKYAAQSGIGEGHAWVYGQNFVVENAFEQKWNCAQNSSAKLYAWGYKLVNPVDNGWLNLVDATKKADGDNVRDIAITASGNGSTTAAAKTTTSGYYRYADADFRDSFFYAWILTQSSADETTETITIAPERAASPSPQVGEITLPSKDDKSSSSDTSSGSSYADAKAEAIFAKEYLPTDNMGDINFDGIPDLYYVKYFQDDESSSSESTEEGTTSYADLTNYSLSDNGNPDSDYLPGELTAAVTKYTTNLADGVAFKATWEVRGFGEGLNNAATDFNNAIVSGVKPDVVYLDPDTCATSTLSRVEYQAWLKFAATKGYTTEEQLTNSANWYVNGKLIWSPECPTDPTLYDTDDDGFPDGFEYYYWYRAHVGYFNEQGVHVFMTGRRYDVRNPGTGTIIPASIIEERMNPTVSAGTDGLERDSDNDGLSDYLECVLGTNPFDFDTDGDGLPDGYELMAGFDYMTGGEQVRFFDGDAMAYTVTFNPDDPKKGVSAEYDLAIKEGRPTTEIKVYTTFAVIDEEGATDGIQWYAVEDAAALSYAEATNTVESYWTFKVGKVNYVTTNDLYFTAANELAAPLLAKNTFTYEEVDVEEEDASDPENVVTNIVKAPMCGMPTYLPAGTKFAEAPVKVENKKLVVRTIAADTEVISCWVYGNNTESVDGEAKPVLALAVNTQVKAGAVIVAAAAENRPVAYLHHHVYQEFGFDPRTAWSIFDPVSSRWAKKSTSDGVTEAVSGVNVINWAFAGVNARTRAFTTYDEFLLVSYFRNNGVLTDEQVTATKTKPWSEIWKNYTTNPLGPEDEDLGSVVNANATEVNGFGWDTNGADTDADGVPDGWELYVMAGKKVDGKFNPASPYSAMTPLSSVEGISAKLLASTDVEMDNDGLSEWQEFAGTDSVAHYTEIQTGYEAAFSTTISRPSEHVEWINKFFPTDPWNADTDNDGLTDAQEAAAFKYGSPVDNGILISVPGGGLNPCSVDTDLDGIPDEWEKQFKGSTVYAGENPTYASGANGGNPLEGLTDGMDGTVCDAYNVVRENTYDSAGNSNAKVWTVTEADGRVWSGKVNRDYDRDGLENWQEYLVGAMRCWRYDDPYTPFTAFPKETYYVYDKSSESWVFDAKHAAEALKISGSSADEKIARFWYETLFNTKGKYYNPYLITDSAFGPYFSKVTNSWDPAFVSPTVDSSRAGGGYYIFKDRVNNQLIKDYWVGTYMSPGNLYECVMAAGSLSTPSKYISCSPIDYDTDHDGMDDYYELFHGMNPLLGESGVDLDHDGPADVVYDAWKASDGGAFVAWGTGSDKNYWQLHPWKVARGTGYDFEVFPWLNGLATADPDGDDLRNQLEAITPKMANQNTWYHTDPTPLWMTDSSYSNSLTRLYYRLPTRFDDVELVGKVYSFVDKDTEATTSIDLSAAATYCYDAETSTFYLGAVVPDFWNLSANGCENWIASFEENEGYDSDHDAENDDTEVRGLAHGTTSAQDADDPRRRQAMYFPGENAALQTMPTVKENYPVFGSSYPDDPSFRTFTVECWVKPERLTDQTIIERAIWTDDSNPGDTEFLRRNFNLGIREGKWYACFDTQGTIKNDQIEIKSTSNATTNWTHLAATLDGSRFVIYVNGELRGALSTSEQPEYGASALAYKRVSEREGEVGRYWFSCEYTYKALLIGASFKNKNEKGEASALDVTNAKGWGSYKQFFQGFIDEVRIWDGARTLDEINADYKNRIRYSRTELLANRDEFYEQWADGVYRYEMTDKVDNSVVPELRYYFSFDSVPGAMDASSVIKEPEGFSINGGKAILSRPVGYTIAWWKPIAEQYGSVYGGIGDWVQWIPNLVAHLPRYDGTTLDSMFWTENYAGDNANDDHTFSRRAEPVSMWTQMKYNGVNKAAWYSEPAGLQIRVAEVADKDGYLEYQFAARHLNQVGDDLLPLGGAFAKYCDDMWDDEGASAPWEYTGVDTDNDGLPDWWEEYARTHYGATDNCGWDTILTGFGNYTAGITAGSAYIHDLYFKGMMIENGKVITENLAYVNHADADKDGMEDWWENIYGIQSNSVNDARCDADNDGLSNLQEWWISYDEDKGFGLANNFPILDPTASRSTDDDAVSDYFLTMASGEYKGWYMGEIVGDHDFIEDAWEDNYPSSIINRYVYDADKDPDGDGWSNYAEARARTAPDKVSRSAIEGYTTFEYPIPVVNLTLSTASSSGVSNANLVVEARAQGSKSAKYDARWKVGGSQSTSSEKFVGFNPGTYKHYNIGGSIVPGTFKVSFKDLTGDLETYVVNTNSGTKTKIESLKVSDDLAVWCEVVVDTKIDGNSSEGYLVYRGDGNSIVGTINYETGDVYISFADILRIGWVWGTWISDTQCIVTYLWKSYVKITWTSNASVEATGADIHLVLADATDGYLKEGQNDFIAYFDTDGNGMCSDDELLGFKRGVDVGWSEIPELRIELKASSDSADRFAVGSYEGDYTRVCAVRTAINGQKHEPLKRRAVYAKWMDLSSGKSFNESDFIAVGEYDFDQKYLIADAEAMGIAASDIREATYEFYVGSASNVVHTFTRTFDYAGIKPNISDCYSNADYTVLTTRPTLRWKASTGYSFFTLQIAEDNNFSNVVYTTTDLMPAADSIGCVFTPEAYAGAELKDNTCYYWRVAQCNSKFMTNVWSEVASFKMSVNDHMLETLYGRIQASVKFFGADDNINYTNVVVGVYESADFTGSPVARKRAVLGSEPLVFEGIAAGDYYVMAYVDKNQNGKRDSYETWGYVNNVGTSESSNLYDPQKVTVTENMQLLPSVSIYMEDTDVNQNKTPDCLEDMTGWVASDSIATPSEDDEEDSDRDGLTTAQEHAIGTLPDVADSDGDGMPDGWEVRADLDPLYAADATSAVVNDMFAYAVTNLYIAVRDGVEYAVKPATDEDDIDRLYRTFRLSDNTLVVGAPTNLKREQSDSTTMKSVVLIHSAVYDFYGYDNSTARLVLSGTNYVAGANTQSFTAFWKYITDTEYLPQFGINTEPVLPNFIDSNSNKIDDGWELYVGVARVAPSPSFPVTENEKIYHAFANNYDPYDPYSIFELFTTEEDKASLVPFTNDEAFNYDFIDVPSNYWSYASARDVMAYAELDLYVAEKDGKLYAVRPDGSSSGEISLTNRIYTTFELANGQLVVGAPTSLKVSDTESQTYTNVVLIHSAVYDFLGFNSTTARAVTNAVDTVPFTRAWKWVTNKAYLPEFGINTMPVDIDKIDSSSDSIDDGWELYVGLADVAVVKSFPASELEIIDSAYGHNRCQLVYDPHHTLVYDENEEPIDNITAVEYRLVNTSSTNSVYSLDMTSDYDNDGLTNYQEYKAKNNLALTLDVDLAYTDGATPDYFRVGSSGKYAGEFYNGAEWIENNQRSELDLDLESRAGTRVYQLSGWDNWSVARYTQSDAADFAVIYTNINTIVGLEPNIKHEDEQGAFDYAPEALQRLQRLGKIKFVSYEYVNEVDEKSGAINRYLRLGYRNMSSDGGNAPVPEITLTLEYASNESKTVILEAYQVNSVYPEMGEQMTARWSAEVVFNSGVAKVTMAQADLVSGKPKQGPARFIAYIDDGDGEYSAADIVGTAESAIGFLGCDLLITLGDPNAALPTIELGSSTSTNSDTKVVQSVAILRTAVNGKTLEKPRGVYVNYFPNNVARERLYPSDFVRNDFVGVDRFLASDYTADELSRIYSVTYTVIDGKDRPYTSSTYTNCILSTIKMVYSEGRDKATINAISEALDSTASLSFKIPHDTINSKFWLKVNGQVFGGTTGYEIPYVASDLVTVFFKDHPEIEFNVGADNTFQVALGNDKYGYPAADDFCAEASQYIGVDADRRSGYQVTIKHPTAKASEFAEGKMVVAAYTYADLAEPIAWTSAKFDGNPIALSGLRQNEEYYVAAWYVRNENDGRGEDFLRYRQPYDTWGYYASFGSNTTCFAAMAMKATATNGAPATAITIYLQDTDFNDNDDETSLPRKLDRNEEMTAVYSADNAIDEVDPLADFDEDGIPDTFDNNEPVLSLEDDPDERSEDEAARIARGDLMACCDLDDMTFVKVGTSSTDASWYVLMDAANDVKLADGQTAEQTSAELLQTAATIYWYGTPGKSVYGVGTNVTFTAADGKVQAVSNGTVRLVHAQVYAKFGFDTLTCNPEYPSGPNTKVFTTADKYLVVRYLEAIGVEGVDEAKLMADPDNELWDLYFNEFGTIDDEKYRADADRDGIKDGWELYTMFGPQGGLTGFMQSDLGAISAAKISPFNTSDGQMYSPDNGGLLLVAEYDAGHYPTDPWDVDSDKDGIADKFAYQYHLKGDDAKLDPDGDGLSNYSEYLTSEVFKFYKISPDNATTVAPFKDYFLRVGSMYLGEIFQDHDQMDDEIEDELGFNRSVYDAHLDTDGDGWSNYAEAKGKVAAGEDEVVTQTISTNLTKSAIYELERDSTVTNLKYDLRKSEGWDENWLDLYAVTYTRETVIKAYPGYPIPDIRAEISYNGEQLDNGASADLVVHFYRDATMRSLDATYVITNAIIKGVNNVVLSKQYLVSGYVREGRNYVEAYVLKAVNDNTNEQAGGESSTSYQAGMPFGINTQVDIGWSSPSFELELTDMTAIFDRITPFETQSGRNTSARLAYYGADSITVASNGQSVISSGDVEHIRIVPYLVSGIAQDDSATEVRRSDCQIYSGRVVAEFDVDKNAHPYIHEGDFLKDGQFDIDWDDFATEMANDDTIKSWVKEVTCVKYRIVIGKDGPVSMSGQDDTNVVVKALSTLVERRFERTKNRTRAVPVEASGFLYAAQPTFKWRLDESTDVVGNAGSAAFFGCSYTAFRIQVTTSDDVDYANVVYDSGVVRAPIRDQDENFVWTAPFYPENGSYIWRVVMYNSKFKPTEKAANDYWSSVKASFTVDKNRQSDMNDHGYGTVYVMPRYCGHEKVLEQGTVIVEAFDTADFTGYPLARVTLSDNTAVADAYDLSNMVAVAGLEMKNANCDGVYHLRAFIDQNGNAERDDFESWGYCEPITLDNDYNNRRAHATTIFIEDADTDQDWIPDAYEYARIGKGTWDVVKNFKNAATSDMISIDTTKLTTGAGISVGLDGASLTVFETGSFANTLLGLEGTATYEQIRDAVNKELKPTTVKIIAITLNTEANEVTLTLDGEVSLSLPGEYVSQIYGITAGTSTTVTVKVYKKNTLLDANWTEVETIENVSIGANAASVVVNPKTKLDPTTGFYRVVVEK